MSDWTDEAVAYEENNWEDLAVEFIEQNIDIWNDFVADKFFNQLGEMLHTRAEHYRDMKEDR